MHEKIREITLSLKSEGDQAFCFFFFSWPSIAFVDFSTKKSKESVSSLVFTLTPLDNTGAELNVPNKVGGDIKTETPDRILLQGHWTQIDAFQTNNFS